MRALLVVNPAATSTSARTRDVLLHALASEMKLEAVTTEYRGHARDLGRRAAESSDIDLVVALGGDGTVNEVVNGLLYNGPSPSCRNSRWCPADRRMSSRGRSGCPMTRWSRPVRFSTPCARTGAAP